MKPSNLRGALLASLILTVASSRSYGNGISGNPSPGAPLPLLTEWEEYHDKTAAQHTVQTAILMGQGYRMTSLSVSGSPYDPRYSAVWVKRAGPQFFPFTATPSRTTGHSSSRRVWRATGPRFSPSRAAPRKTPSWRASSSRTASTRGRTR